MSNALIKANLAELNKASEDEEKVFGELAEAKSFMPRLQMMQALSAQVSSDEAKKGEWLFIRSKESFTNLGTEFNFIPLSWRHKALEFGDEVRAFYDITSPDFLRVKAAAETPNNGAVAGPEFLLWIPELASYCTYHLTSMTSQGQAKALRGLIGSGAQLKSKQVINKKKQAYYVPECNAFGGDLSLPDEADLMATVAAFRSPKSSEIEAAETSEADAGRAR